MTKPNTPEHERLADSEARRADWKNWGPYVSDRAWGTVREDYSEHGTAWEYFSHDHARSRAYRWNEDGIAGFCNRMQNICMGVAFWNERDEILKERFFGLTGHQGNHGEDVKEYYFYLDSTPTHSYCRMLYKYPQVAYPYEELVQRNADRSKEEREYELIDALNEAFAEDRYFDVFIEYAKADQQDILCRITAINRSAEAAPIHILPHVWFRNTWSWGHNPVKPELVDVSKAGIAAIRASHRHLGERWWYAMAEDGSESRTLFTENDTNRERLFGTPNPSPYVKDGIHEAVIHGKEDAVNPQKKGTKAAVHFKAVVEPGAAFVVSFRFADKPVPQPFDDAEEILAKRKTEADAFYSALHPSELSEDERRVQRQALAGLMWSKQFYHYSIDKWLHGDKLGPNPPQTRKNGRNHDWEHLYNLDVISMPDKWEYPWYAAWDLAFHMIPVAMIDPEWAKRQLILMTREWYMHPNGQLPAYEWEFGDVNPPVHAWAAWRVYKITEKMTGRADTDFLERIFHKMLLNFTWWINRKDNNGNNIFQGGFLGLDNIGVFDRSMPLPHGGYLEQADGTAWMGMYCLNMLMISLELAQTRPAYEDVATKFFEHFVYIANAINKPYEHRGLWHEENGFYYDALHTPNDHHIPLMIHSFVGLIPLFAVETIEPRQLETLPRFKKRMNWFIKHRSHLMKNLTLLNPEGGAERCLLSLVNERQLRRILSRMLDSDQFLSDYGLRSLSKQHEAEPFRLNIDGHIHSVDYEPAESKTGMFGGNSNWRGPIWLPVNYLMIESLQKFNHFFGDRCKVEMPTDSGRLINLDEVATDLSQRLMRIFLRDGGDGRRPFYGEIEYFQNDPHWRDYVLFYEYFHGDNGAGIGASHQTGWTALVAKLIQQSGGRLVKLEESVLSEDSA